jgi:hypothetical protein
MEKWFDQDKNYILKQAQYSYKEAGVQDMVRIAVDSYLFKNNPLGLVDDFVKELMNYQSPSTHFLYRPYQLLAGIYRLLHSDNQLEFSWEGKSHFEIFTEEWKNLLEVWMLQMCHHSYLDKMIIKGAIINPSNDHLMLEAHINKIIYQTFPIKKTKKGALVAA